MRASSVYSAFFWFAVCSADPHHQEAHISSLRHHAAPSATSHVDADTHHQEDQIEKSDAAPPSTSPVPTLQPPQSTSPSNMPSTVPNAQAWISSNLSFPTNPTFWPSMSRHPSTSPSLEPSDIPSISAKPTSQPTDLPSISSAPSRIPSVFPSSTIKSNYQNVPLESPSISSLASSTRKVCWHPQYMNTQAEGYCLYDRNWIYGVGCYESKRDCCEIFGHGRSENKLYCLSRTPTGGVLYPTLSPTISPSIEPTLKADPTDSPTLFPSMSPSQSPSSSPTESATPTLEPTLDPPAVKFWCWGYSDSFGIDFESPGVMDDDDIVIDVGTGSGYTVKVLTNGTALSAGSVFPIENYKGHLGRGNVVQAVNEAQLISLVWNSDETLVNAPSFDKVFAGVENSDNSGIGNLGTVHTILLDTQGQAWATGSNNQGQLCLGDNTNQYYPKKIEMTGRIVDVAIGGEHTLLLDEFGQVYGCGSNAVGQLGLGNITDITIPTKIDILRSVTSVSAGHKHSLFKTENGMYVTGSNEFGQLCAGTNGLNVATPSFTSTNDVNQFEAIKSSSYILYSDGYVESCGRNDVGQLGDGTNINKVRTTPALGASVTRLFGVGPSAESVFFVTNDGRVFGTGLNDVGQLGTGDRESKNIPTAVEFQQRVILGLVSASSDHTCALGSTIEGN